MQALSHNTLNGQKASVKNIGPYLKQLEVKMEESNKLLKMSKAFS